MSRILTAYAAIVCVISFALFLFFGMNLVEYTKNPETKDIAYILSSVSFGISGVSIIAFIVMMFNFPKSEKKG